ncbi:aminotransferase class I/II-fold pyridoxal phosphate-dependent enzyme [Algoriphagus sp. SE2]|uniref:aminotransferase class I/II-fold pyridoxal phosphate-dependent enzyme n=1 Tax=Algoriphagus sp. SE2 TaxID=3141536 RepID=UPI0031CD029B
MNIFNLEQKIDRLIDYQGKTYRYFSGTSYLGIGMVPEFQEKIVEGLWRYGLNHGQSRGNNVRLAVYDEFEAFFADSAQAESSLVMSSGYLTGTAALRLLKKEESEIWVAPDTHPAILPLDLAPNPRQSFEDWKIKCLEKSENLPPQKILILGNAVDPLQSTIHDYSWIARIGTKHDLTILIDDSHAFGVIGESLFGTYSKLKKLPAKVVVSGSIGKGLGLPAGIILCDRATKDEILNLPIYGGASPCSPGYLQAFLESQDLYLAQKKKLSTNCDLFYQETIKLNGILGNPEFPVFNYFEETWVDKLEQSGFITSSFPYPTAKDPRLNRIVISGFHLKNDLELLIEKLIELSST